MILQKKSLRFALSDRLKYYLLELPSPANAFRRALSAKSISEIDVTIYNSLSKQIERLPESSKAIAWYTCGPTTYAPAHLGHARTYVCIDIMRRVLEAHVSKPPLFTMNITDIDDKILKAAEDTGENPVSLARRYESEFWEDMDSLNCLRPHVVARVTERVESDIIPYIETLLSKGMAYETENGIYFDVKNFSLNSFSKYGKLSPHASTEQTATDEIEDCDAKVKRDQRDFVLWKKLKSSESVCWEAPWGKGRPGWHIECSAIIESIQRQFEDTHHFSVHAGGVDLKFPHHTNEIAQAEAYRGGEWINHWVHTGHLHIDGLKMSKSLKNFISIRDFMGNYDMSSSADSPGDDFRLWCLGLSGPYRSPATFSKGRLSEARSIRQKILRFLHGGEAWLAAADDNIKLWNDSDFELHRLSLEVKHNCTLALRNDFDGSEFLHELMRVIGAGSKYFTNRPDGSIEAVRTALRIVRELLRLVGFSSRTTDAGQRDTARDSLEKNNNHNAVDTLVSLRSRMRKIALDQKSRDGVSKDLLELCDELRDSILDQGVEILDSRSGESDGWRPCLRKSVHRQTIQSDNSSDEQVDFHTIPVEDFFKTRMYDGQYSQFDAYGLPTHNADGSKVSTRLLKKLLKKREIHTKRLAQKIKEI